MTVLVAIDGLTNVKQLYTHWVATTNTRMAFRVVNINASTSVSFTNPTTKNGIDGPLFLTGWKSAYKVSAGMSIISGITTLDYSGTRNYLD
jgi:hypothetical protein